MPEARPDRRPALAAAAIAALLILATGVGGVVAAVAGALAQPALALAVRARDGLQGLDRATALRGRGLGAALGLGAVAGVCVVALWRSWPLWRASAREGGTLGAHWQALDARDASGWHGLGAAACVAAILGSILLLAWPGLLGPQ